MSRKKSVTIARKPRARSQPVATDASEGQESIPQRASSEHFAAVPANVAEDLADEPGSEGRASLSFGFLGKALYGTVYGISYGVVFGALLIGKLLPGENIIAKAMTDATDSAKLAFAGLGKHQEKQKRNERATSKNSRTATGLPQERGLVA